MKFVDEAVITVQAGQGGHGCLSFRREKFLPKGGPDGGNGGRGGSVYLRADESVSTLADFRYTRHHQAQRGGGGSGQDRTGRNGEDLIIDVPVGTVVVDDETQETIGDLVRAGELLLVAAGGDGGLGNAHFKSSVNRAPRRTTLGHDADRRRLRLELKILADVGLLGLPNAGKSTFLSVISHAHPKIADYPFTTLYPQLGVVRVDDFSFVVADIPGLIEGAAEGVGLGVRFLKHLSRTRLLLHLVDMSPLTESVLSEDVAIVFKELKKFSDELSRQERWLVLNKCDLLPEDRHAAVKKELVDALDWTGPVFVVSAVTGFGCQTLCNAVAAHLNKPVSGSTHISQKFRGIHAQAFEDG